MIVKDFFKNHCRCSLKLFSAYNDKLLCKSFNPQKHVELAEREILSIWADVEVTKGANSKMLYPIICAYVNGRIEYQKEKGGEPNA